MMKTFDLIAEAEQRQAAVNAAKALDLARETREIVEEIDITLVAMAMR